MFSLAYKLTNKHLISRGDVTWCHASVDLAEGVSFQDFLPTLKIRTKVTTTLMFLAETLKKIKLLFKHNKKPDNRNLEASENWTVLSDIQIMA